MAKFNVTDNRKKVTGPVTTTTTAMKTTHQYGAPAYGYDLQSELFQLAVANFVGEDTYYESGDARDNRYKQLIHAAAVQHPVWTVQFLAWLRNGANMRSASLVGALEAAKAMVDAGVPGSRQAVKAVLQRADEPGEAIAYWHAHYGRKIPQPVKRGIADAVNRLYTEDSLLKYDTASKGVRFGDVIELTHPSTDQQWRSDLYRYAIDRRHGRADGKCPGLLPVILHNNTLRATEDIEQWLDPEALKRAGMTWEDALSAVGSKVDKAKLWEAMIPSMGYMALLRNLRNFDEAGISAESVAYVVAKLSDPEQVARSKQFPYRFLAAYENLSSLRYGPALEAALRQSLSNIPELPGRTLVLVDTSDSMSGGGFSKKSTMTPAKAARIFGTALAIRNPGRVDLYGFGDRPYSVNVPKGADMLPTLKRFEQAEGSGGYGTNIGGSLRQTFAGHDRVFIISDMQTMTSLADYDSGNRWGYSSYAERQENGIDKYVKPETYVYGFNLGGYGNTQVNTTKARRWEFGSLGDTMFKLVPLLERGEDQGWPWED